MVVVRWRSGGVAVKVEGRWCDGSEGGGGQEGSVCGGGDDDMSYTFLLSGILPRCGPVTATPLPLSVPYSDQFLPLSNPRTDAARCQNR